MVLFCDSLPIFCRLEYAGCEPARAESNACIDDEQFGGYHNIGDHIITGTDIHGYVTCVSALPTLVYPPRCSYFANPICFPGSGSKAWIAGTVVGSVVGTALMMLRVILFLRCKKLVAQADKRLDHAGDGTYMTGFKPELPSDPVPQPPRIYQMDASQNLSEMAAHEKPQELSAEKTNRIAREPAGEPS